MKSPNNGYQSNTENSFDEMFQVRKLIHVKFGQLDECHQINQWSYKQKESTEKYNKTL